MIRLLLNAEELKLFDDATKATKFTRSSWVTGLVRQALSGRARLSSADRVNIAALVKELRKIEAASQRSARMLADLEATARECLARCKAVEQFNTQVGAMADALDELFRGNDAYWRSMLDGQSNSETPASSSSHKHAAK